MSLKKVFLAVSAVIILVGCQTDDGLNFNHQGKYDVEKPIIDEFLATHMYDADTDELIALEEGGVALDKDDNLIESTIEFNDVNYSMYSYISKEGSVDLLPDDNDRVFVGYSVHTLTQDTSGNLIQSTNPIDENYNSDTFFDLSSTAIYRGWKLGIQVFKGGESNETDLTIPRQFTGEGKGFMIMPSGLTHAIEGNQVNDLNTILVFKIELRKVVDIEDEDDSEE